MTGEHVTLTRAQALMLAALADACERDGNPVALTASPGQLARMRWPDSVGWSRRTRKFGTNDPGAVGGTMPMKAATVLWRLRAIGLADRVGASYDAQANLWQPTERGLRWLADHDVP